MDQPQILRCVDGKPEVPVSCAKVLGGKEDLDSAEGTSHHRLARALKDTERCVQSSDTSGDAECVMGDDEPDIAGSNSASSPSTATEDSSPSNTQSGDQTGTGRPTRTDNSTPGRLPSGTRPLSPYKTDNKTKEPFTYGSGGLVGTRPLSTGSPESGGSSGLSRSSRSTVTSSAEESSTSSTRPPVISGTSTFSSPSSSTTANSTVTPAQSPLPTAAAGAVHGVSIALVAVGAFFVLLA
ncbi:MAG: hypothetical protein M1837_005441 [Sclerophora amabilis]|nr:MAG: hypothetical protein M1837_005441 [Sclerophora amabilis]